jgi:chemotaxis protein methyltransferase CheR
VVERHRVILASGTDAPPGPPPAPTADLELQLLLDAVYRAAGYDFREYAPAVLKRRVADRVRAEEVATISGLQEAVLHRSGAMERFVDAVTAVPSAPFAEPPFFAEARSRVLARLRTFPFVRVWVAGCGAGDDAYALAILFQEAEIAHRVRIYATDAGERAVDRARAGKLAARELDASEERYAASGGARRFGDYVDAAGSDVAYCPELRAKIVFAQHNLAMDGSFNEFHLIVVRHVLGQFNRTLAYRAHQVIFESLVRLGILGVGGRDALRSSPHQRAYEPLGDGDAFFRRVR